MESTNITIDLDFSLLYKNLKIRIIIQKQNLVNTSLHWICCIFNSYETPYETTLCFKNWISSVCNTNVMLYVCNHCETSHKYCFWPLLLLFVSTNHKLRMHEHNILLFHRFLDVFTLFFYFLFFSMCTCVFAWKFISSYMGSCIVIIRGGGGGAGVFFLFVN